MLLCSGAESDSCLTAAQLEALKSLYAGPGRDIYPGFLPGPETGWMDWITGNVTFSSTAPYLNGTLPKHLSQGAAFFKYFIFDDENWDYNTLNFTSDVWATNHKSVCAYGRCMPMEAVINSESPDLRRFEARGNKIVQYHGFSDPDISPLVSIHYYEQVTEHMKRASHRGRKGEHHHDALEATQSFYRLFMVPGMHHCSGGPGPTTFDALTALEQWVEDGIAPDQISASHVTNSQTTMTRPLCPYPQEAIYRGTGDTNQIASFFCGVK